MNTSYTYQFFIQGILSFVLICQLWTSALSYCVLFFDAEIEYVDYVPCEERESEEEKTESEEKNEEKSDEFVEGAFDITKMMDDSRISPKYQIGFYWSELQEIFTPPPESISLCS